MAHTKGKMKIHQLTVSYQGDVVDHYKVLTDRGIPLTQIQTVTVASPNSFGNYHPRYLVIWQE